MCLYLVIYVFALNITYFTLCFILKFLLNCEPKYPKMTYFNTILTFIFLLSYVLGCAVANASDGYVPVRNFTVSDYSGNAQNWGAVQDSLGRVYVANGYGMLCYDGGMWHLYHLPNYTSVRSLLYDKDTGRIYAGGSEEFGYFSSKSPDGALVYTSLSDKLDQLHPSLTEVWRIIKADGRIWFQGDYHFFGYDGQSLVTYDTKSRIAHSAEVGGRVYVALDNGGMLRMNNGRMQPVSGLDAIAGTKIVTMLPWEDEGKMLIGTSFDGLFIYDGNRAEKYTCDIDGFLKRNQLFCASSQGEDYVFGTVNHGAVVKNFTTGRVEYINKDVGLLNNTVLAADFDYAGNIWLSLDYGLGYAVYNTPVWSITGVSGPIGAGYASLVMGNRIYLGTNQGLFTARYPLESTPSPAKFEQLLRGQVWSINNYGNTIFVGSDAGAYVSEGGERFYKIDGLDGTTRIRLLNGSDDRALALTYHGFQLLGRINGRWTALGRLDGYDDIAADFVQDKFGDIWLAHWRKGVFRLRYNDKSATFGQCRLFDHDSGLPDDKNTSLVIYKERVVVSTQGGYYYFNAKNEDMRPDTEVADIFGGGIVGSFRALGDSVMAVIDSKGISMAVLGRNGKFNVDTTSLRNIGNKLIPGYTDLYRMPDGKMLLSGYEGFWCINPGHDVDRHPVTLPFVSSVTANGDSLVYRASVEVVSGELPRLEVSYNINNLRFNFGCADYCSPDGVEYSSYLEGYDNEPSDFTTEKSREYTKVPNGKYTFHLRSKNLHTGMINDASLEVVILPPWYKTIFANIMWVLLVILLSVGVYMLISRRITKSRKALEKRKEEEYAALEMQARHDSMVKDMEIATLRSEHLEQDIKHKSQELCDTTRNLIHKNEVLQDISEKLKYISELLASDMGHAAAQRKLAKIQQMIDYNLSHDNDWAQFAGSFDVVYSNFTKRLMELHPNLSISDKRLCCYIRMGLSSKEIAPLINISSKSVEMARYRVRKKLGLAVGDSLTNYLDAL